MDTERLLIFAVELLKMGNDEKASSKIAIAKALDEDDFFESYTEQLYLELKAEDQELAIKFKDLYSKHLEQELEHSLPSKPGTIDVEDLSKSTEKQSTVEVETESITTEKQSEEQEEKSPLLIKWLVITIAIFMVLYVFDLLLATN